MADDKETIKVVLDWKTGVVYGLRFDEDGECVGAERGSPGPIVRKPGAPPAMPPMGGPQEQFPYGETTYAIDPTGEGTYDLYTIVWPEKEDAKPPQVAVTTLPEDLVKAGIAKWPDGLKDPGVKAAEDEEALKAALEKINTLIGLDRVKRDLKQSISTARIARVKQELGIPQSQLSFHRVFTGNPGTGKTTVAREYAKVLHALGFIKKPVVHEIQAADLIAGFVGQTGGKTREAIEKAKGGVLFIDEAYGITAGANGRNYGQEAIAEMVAAMENNRNNLVIIVAGYPGPMKQFIEANPGLKSRFLHYLEFDDYNGAELGQIMDLMLKEKGYTMTVEAREKAIQLVEAEREKGREHFGNGRTVRNLMDLADINMSARLDDEGFVKGSVEDILDRTGMSEDDLRAKLTTVTLDDVAEINLSGITKGQGNRMGFGEGESNDNEKTATPVIASPGGAQASRISLQRPDKKFRF